MDLSDYMCTICMGILIEPVTMPCKHTMCKVCFEKNLEVNSLLCPMCKKRVGTWARRKKPGELVNAALWRQIQTRFPEKVKLKMDGFDEDMDELNELFPCLPTHMHADKGQIRSEFESDMAKWRTEIDELKQKEEEESLKLIKQLQQQDEEDVEQNSHNSVNEDEEASLRLIRRLQQEENEKANKTSQKTVKSSPAAKQKSSFFTPKRSDSKTCDRDKKENKTPESCQPSASREFVSQPSTSRNFVSSQPSTSKGFSRLEDESSPICDIDGLTEEMLAEQRAAMAQLKQLQEDEVMARSLAHNMTLDVKTPTVTLKGPPSTPSSNSAKKRKGSCQKDPSKRLKQMSLIESLSRSNSMGKESS